MCFYSSLEGDAYLKTLIMPVNCPPTASLAVPHLFPASIVLGLSGPRATKPADWVTKPRLQLHRTGLGPSQKVATTKL